MIRRSTAPALAILVAAAALAAQDAPPPADSQPTDETDAPTFPAQIDQVVVDVVVTDTELLGPPAATDHAPPPTGDPSAKPTAALERASEGK